MSLVPVVAGQHQGDKLWQAMLAVGPCLVPIFMTSAPSLTPGQNNIHFDGTTWAKATVDAAKRLCDTHQAALEAQP